MAGYQRIVNTPPILDGDGSLWTVSVCNQGPDATIVIQVCDGITTTARDAEQGSDYQTHDFDGEFHNGDLHLFLDNAAAYRLLFQLEHAFADTTPGRPTAAGADAEPRPAGRFCFADCPDCESSNTL